MSEQAGSLGSVEVAPGVVLPKEQVRFSFTRSRGPGGQNVNKVASRAVLEVNLADLRPRLNPGWSARFERLAASAIVGGDHLQIASEEDRSQLANRRHCLEKLRQLLLASRKAPRVRRPTKASRGSIERRLQAKQQRGQIKNLRQRPAGE